MMLKTALILVAGAASGAQAFWRMECRGRVGVARLDPLLAPGGAAEHAHVLHGSNGLSESSEWADLRAGNCSSCLVTEDKSAYWTPALYFQDENTGQFELAEQVGGMIAYYLLRGNNITAFPPGFSMIAGDSNRRNYTAGNMYEPDPDQSHWAELGETTQDRLRQRAVGFTCLDYNRKTQEGTLYRHYMPNKDYVVNNCFAGLRADIAFPSCWNGVDLDSDNHKDHMAYSNLILDGSCPDTHPYRTPLLLYETIWNVVAFQNRTGRFVWANGDTTGLGYHGDFVAGWDPTYLQDAINTCVNPSGQLKDCPVFSQAMQTEDQARQCLLPSLPSNIAHENTTGPIDGLPGGVLVFSPDSAAYPTHTDELTYSPGATPHSSGAFLPGEIFVEHSTSRTGQMTVPAAPTTTPSPVIEIRPTEGVAETTTTTASLSESATMTSPSNTLTTAAAITKSSTSNGRIFSTQWVTRSSVVQEVLWELEVVSITKTQDLTTTVTVTGTPTLGKMRRNVRHPRHGRGN